MTTKLNKHCIEALLFASGEPLTLDTLSNAAGVEESVCLRYLMELKGEYADRGILIRQVAGGFQMASNPVYHEEVARVAHVKVETTLSRASLETLAVVVRHQPLTGYAVAKHRGVKNSEHTLTTLLSEGLVSESEAGFRTTEKFLTYFGINDLSELSEKFTMIHRPKPVDESVDEANIVESDHQTDNEVDSVTVHTNDVENDQEDTD